MGQNNEIKFEFITYLQEELVRRCRTNPAYSLRAFARSLDFEPSALSKILRGKRNLSQVTFRNLAKRLGLSPVQVEKLEPPRRKRKNPFESVLKISDYNSITPEMFEIISDWHHFAILELIATNTFKPNAKVIARQLGITASEVNIAAKRLENLGFLEVTPDGTWKDISGSVTAARGFFTSGAARKLQMQVLEKSMTALQELPIHQRDHSSMCMAIDSRKLPEAKERIKKFRRELCEFLKGDKPPRDQVYHLAISLYPVSQLSTNTGHKTDRKPERNLK